MTLTPSIFSFSRTHHFLGGWWSVGVESLVKFGSVELEKKFVKVKCPKNRRVWPWPINRVVVPFWSVWRDRFNRQSFWSYNDLSIDSSLVLIGRLVLEIQDVLKLVFLKFLTYQDNIWATVSRILEDLEGRDFSGHQFRSRPACVPIFRPVSRPGGFAGLEQNCAAKLWNLASFW